MKTETFENGFQVQTFYTYRFHFGRVKTRRFENAVRCGWVKTESLETTTAFFIAIAFANENK